MTERKRVLALFEAEKDALREKTEKGIEAHRKGDFSIRVTDKDGRPVKGAKVKLVQKAHAFRFGANLFMLDELETPEKNQLYKERFAALFNMATLPFYWDALEPEEGKPRFAKDSARVYRRPAPDLCLEFCEAHGIEPREHALAYEQFFPKWLYGAPISRVKAALEKRFAEIAARYADKIPTIEITNEMLWEEGRTSFYDDADYVAWCFKTAEKYFPNNQLAVNDATDMAWGMRPRTCSAYYSYLEAALLKGARIDAVGMQFHMFSKREREYEETRPYYDPKNLFAHMDLFARLGKPLQITEITVPSYSWEKEDEEIQADILEYLYSIWFSHPAVEQIIYWNLIDGYAHVWDPDPAVIAASQGNMAQGENYYHGGLLRFDLSKKPAFDRLDELINRRWHTEEALETDADGNASVRAFYGTYTLEIVRDGESVTHTAELLPHGEREVQLVL